MLIGVTSVQLGAAVAKSLFVSLGPGGTVFLRIGFGVVILLILSRPHLSGYKTRDYAVAVLFGIALGTMNYAFYSALARVPLGIAVTFEFMGPLGVAIAGSRRILDGLWAMLAGAGILLLAPWGGLHVDALGIVLALTAGTCWAMYIVLGARVGQTFPGRAGLTLAMLVGTILLLPVGVLSSGRTLLQPDLLLTGVLVALLSSVIPYSMEIEALRRLPTRVFGVLMSTEPAVATVIGFVALHEVLQVRALLAIVMVTVASVGATRFSSAEVATT